MTTTTQPSNRLNASFTGRMLAQSSSRVAPPKQGTAHSFIAVLLRCLSAVSA